LGLARRELLIHKAIVPIDHPQGSVYPEKIEPEYEARLPKMIEPDIMIQDGHFTTDKTGYGFVVFPTAFKEVPKVSCQIVGRRVNVPIRKVIATTTSLEVQTEPYLGIDWEARGRVK